MLQKFCSCKKNDKYQVCNDDDNDGDDSVQMDTRWCARKWVKRVLSRLNTLLMTPAKNEVDVEVMMTTMTSIKDSKEEVENVPVVTF